MISFNEFIKKFSQNYKNLKEKIDKENEEYLKELEAEENESADETNINDYKTYIKIKI